MDRTARYRTLRDDLVSLPSRLWRGLAANGGAREIFWALEDVSFEVNEGEILGVIGRNGAGKSTLLKILSRIIAPTAGAVDVFGRISSLLEIGTGFHPELSGRENIFLNGAILGMKRHEIRQRFDEIVAFAEVERFLDMPCKHYSSGMYMRLAFSVAAHLSSEILLVDEVLAVGDAEFQRKCLGKMDEVARGGRTVILVSHNLAAIRSLCTRALLLDAGRSLGCGNVDDLLERYRARLTQEGTGAYRRKEPMPAAKAYIENAGIVGRSQAVSGYCLMGEALTVDCGIRICERATLTLSIQLREIGGAPLFHFPNGDGGLALPSTPGFHRFRILIPPLYLYPAAYEVRLTLNESLGAGHNQLDVVHDLLLTVEQDAAVCTRPLNRQAGVIFAKPVWEYLGTG